MGGGDMTDPKPQDLADYLASPAGADDLAELQAAMKESEQPELLVKLAALATYRMTPEGRAEREATRQKARISEDPDGYIPHFTWRVEKIAPKEYYCEIPYHTDTAGTGTATGWGDTALEAIREAADDLPGTAMEFKGPYVAPRETENAKAELELLSRKMTPSERAAQRESFAFGNANASNPEVTRDMVREAIAKEDNK